MAANRPLTVAHNLRDDALRCVSAGEVGLRRFAPQTVDAGGAVRLGPGIVAATSTFPPAARVVACSSYWFQCWYRDPAGPCGAGFNLSNGLEVRFVP